MGFRIFWLGVFRSSTQANRNHSRIACCLTLITIIANYIFMNFQLVITNIFYIVFSAPPFDGA